MQHSADKKNHQANTAAVDGRDFAVFIESLYVANLLILPVLAFIVLVLIFIRKHDSLPTLARSHLEQTISASIWTGIIFFVGAISAMLMHLLGVEEATLWIIIIISFTIIHASMVLLGVAGLAKALAGKCWRYPVVGKSLPPGCIK